MRRHPPERPLIIIQDTREPHADAGDHPDSVFRPCVFASGTPKGTAYADRPRVVIPVERRKLDVGDYSLPGLESVVALERKSGADLLATLFGESGNDALGHARHNVDRFRAELERARSLSLFAIVAECSEGWLFTEAKSRWERYGKSFDPFAALGLLRSFAVDLGTPTIWTGSKGLAELEVGSVLARVWSQATGGEKARDARKRGYASAWLGVLEPKEASAGPFDPVTGEVLPADEPEHGAGVVATGCPSSIHAAHMPGADRPPMKLAPAGGMTASTSEALAARSRKRRSG